MPTKHATSIYNQFKQIKSDVNKKAEIMGLSIDFNHNISMSDCAEDAVSKQLSIDLSPKCLKHGLSDEFSVIKVKIEDMIQNNEGAFEDINITFKKGIMHAKYVLFRLFSLSSDYKHKKLNSMDEFCQVNNCKNILKQLTYSNAREHHNAIDLHIVTSFISTLLSPYLSSNGILINENCEYKKLLQIMKNSKHLFIEAVYYEIVHYGYFQTSEFLISILNAHECANLYVLSYEIWKNAKNSSYHVALMVGGISTLYQRFFTPIMGLENYNIYVYFQNLKYKHKFDSIFNNQLLKIHQKKLIKLFEDINIISLLVSVGIIYLINME